MKNIVLKQQAYEKIKDRILNLDLEPNQRIVEQELALELGISRTPVREAINQLAAEGFIKVIPQRGTYCISLSVRQINDIIDIRTSLETLAVRKCIQNGLTREQVDELTELTRRFEESVQNNDVAHVNRLDNEFHHKIAVFSGNFKLEEYLSDIEDYMVIARNMELFNKGISKSALALEDHKSLLRALIERDLEGAVRSVERNINNMRINLNV